MGEKTHIVQVKSLHQRRRRYAAVFAVCEPAVAVWVVCVCVWQGLVHICIYIYIYQWQFQDPRLEVPTIYKAYVREYPHKIWLYMIQYLHFRILKFPLNIHRYTYIGIYIYIHV